MQKVRAGDVVFHLCGESNRAAFTGCSIAASDCILLDEGPAGPSELYRVELTNYQSFPSPLLLKDVFTVNDNGLRAYFESNRNKSADKERLFYVIQAGRVQCLNGAYLSFISDELLALLFGVDARVTPTSSSAVAARVTAGVVLSEVARRVGQQGFARNVKANFGNSCCFPGCAVSDHRFLVGAHIAKWADNPELRGETSNGLCLCLVHDKAFELGAFTLDKQARVVLGKGSFGSPWLTPQLEAAAGKPILAGSIGLSLEALAHHWRAHGFALDATVAL
ncbi:hypothetical protein G3N95_33235 [Paraburkholderia sp. Tr-20389]|uniref:HNH endonuclease n=1 Tax=Paraburkholderia sp. Tr-20389 TaxID=2703903 RepID=UPI00197E380B|nr:HNH endonuclease [Paraburkholderia sp. Tr-20389]MBN3757826.1 hypothetical protein [Paraburkholderia sp. Tr-20389]